MAFAGIGLSPDSTGEFMFSLFAVICISLMMSWALALTVTPLLGHYFFKQGTAGDDDDAYSGAMFRAYGGVLRGAIKARWLVLPGLVAITVASFMSFGLIKQQFFPNSNTPLFYVHYKLPQGAKIERTAADLTIIEAWLAERDDVVSASTFVGQGATRFLLTYSAEKANPSYGHMIIRTENLPTIPPLIADLEAFAAQACAVSKELGLDPAKVNPNGGAIALGHRRREACGGRVEAARVLQMLRVLLFFFF